MSSKKLLGAYAFFDLCLLTAGIIALVFSIVWRKPDPVLNMVFSSADLTGALSQKFGAILDF
jgi:hypothetical protein